MFLTYMTATEQCPHDKSLYYTLHNQLYEDFDGSLYFVPRYFVTDGYTINNIFAPFVGSKFEHDLRPCIEHDLECRYGGALKVLLNKNELRQKGYLRHKIKDRYTLVPICDDIPIEYLDFQRTTFKDMNERFKRMLKDVGVTGFKGKLIGNAVYLNIGYLGKKQELVFDSIYKEYI